jgi:hypothetical protein
MWVALLMLQGFAVCGRRRVTGGRRKSAAQHKGKWVL